MSAATCLDTSAAAVITGGASGFGLEMGRRCAAAGMRVALLDVSGEEQMAAAAAELRALNVGTARVVTLSCDVGSWDACVAAADAVDAAFGTGSVGFVFNNAGIAGVSGFSGGLLNSTPS